MIVLRNTFERIEKFAEDIVFNCIGDTYIYQPFKISKLIEKDFDYATYQATIGINRKFGTHPLIPVDVHTQIIQKCIAMLAIHNKYPENRRWRLMYPAEIKNHGNYEIKDQLNDIIESIDVLQENQHNLKSFLNSKIGGNLHLGWTKKSMNKIKQIEMFYGPP